MTSTATSSRRSSAPSALARDARALALGPPRRESRRPAMRAGLSPVAVFPACSCRVGLQDGAAFSRERPARAYSADLRSAPAATEFQFGGTCDVADYRGRFEPAAMDDCANASGASYRCAGASRSDSDRAFDRPGRFAISSRMNSTSSSGPLSIVRLSVGGRKKRFVTTVAAAALAGDSGTPTATQRTPAAMPRR